MNKVSSHQKCNCCCCFGLFRGILEKSFQENSTTVKNFLSSFLALLLHVIVTCNAKINDCNSPTEKRYIAWQSSETWGELIKQGTKLIGNGAKTVGQYQNKCRVFLFLHNKDGSLENLVSLFIVTSFPCFPALNC